MNLFRLHRTGRVLDSFFRSSRMVKSSWLGEGLCHSVGLGQLFKAKQYKADQVSSYVEEKFARTHTLCPKRLPTRI